MGMQTEIALLQSNVAALGRRVSAVEDTARAVRELAARVRVLEGLKPAPKLRPREVAARLGRSVDFVRSEIRRGALKASNVGLGHPSYLVSEEQLAEYLERVPRASAKQDTLQEIS